MIIKNTETGLIISNPRDNYYHNTLSFINYLDGQPITEESIRSYFQHLDDKYKSGEYKARTVIIKRAAVKNRIRDAFDGIDFESTMKLDFTLRQIDKKIKEPKINSNSISRNKSVNEDEYNQLLNACNTDRQKLYIKFLIKSAMRINEMINIRLTDIKPDGAMSEITIRGKGTKERQFRIETLIIDEVKTIFRGKIFLFETEKHKQCNKNYISNIITKIGKRINRNISAHSLRHSWATIAIKKHPHMIQEISLLLGHSNSKTTNTFYNNNHLSDAELISII